MNRTWIILYGLAALLTLGPASTAAENCKACTNKPLQTAKATLAQTNNTCCVTATNTVACKAYPLKGLEGKIVRAHLWDQETGKETILGPYEGLKELAIQFPKEDKAYTVIIETYDPETKKWVKALGPYATRS